MKNEQRKVMQIILKAGDAKTLIEDAIQAAKAYDFDKAEELIGQGREVIIEAHNIHTGLFDADIYNDKINILAVHAEDHLNSANLLLKMSYEFVDVYKRLHKIEGQYK